MTALVRALGVSLGWESIRVNAVRPRTTDTPMLRSVADLDNPAVHRIFVDSVPLGRLAQHAELAGPVRFLLSDDASYINATTIAVDGGMAACR